MCGSDVAEPRKPEKADALLILRCRSPAPHCGRSNAFLPSSSRPPEICTVFGFIGELRHFFNHSTLIFNGLRMATGLH